MLCAAGDQQFIITSDLVRKTACSAGKVLNPAGNTHRFPVNGLASDNGPAIQCSTACSQFAQYPHSGSHSGRTSPCASARTTQGSLRGVREAHLVRFEIADLDVDLGTYRFSHMLRVQPGNVAASLCRILIHTESSQYGTCFLRTPFPRGERCRELERFSTPKFTVACPVVCDTRTASGGPSCLQLPSRDGDFGLMIRLSGSRGVLQ